MRCPPYLELYIFPFSPFSPTLSGLTLAVCPCITPTMAIVLAFLSLSIFYAPASSNPFTLDLTWESSSPDGGPQRELIKINGRFPGPLLEVYQGDWVEMVVLNNMPFNTSVHAHGKYDHATLFSNAH